MFIGRAARDPNRIERDQVRDVSRSNLAMVLFTLIKRQNINDALLLYQQIQCRIYRFDVASIRQIFEAESHQLLIAL